MARWLTRPVTHYKQILTKVIHNFDFIAKILDRVWLKPNPSAGARAPKPRGFFFQSQIVSPLPVPAKVKPFEKGVNGVDAQFELWHRTLCKFSVITSV